MASASITDTGGNMLRDIDKKSLLILTILLFACGDNALALEEPEFEVVAERGAYEIRRYDPYIVAEVDVSAETERGAGNAAFRILAGYIFGDNKPRTKMAMTAPVEATPKPEGKGEKMNMTAPVESVSTGDSYTYAFVMERQYTLETLPEPVDPRIRIVTRPARYVAVLRYSGSWSEKNTSRHRTELISALDADELAPRGPVTIARFNSPFALPVFRRNEVQVEVDWPRG
jgi:hypothetical protein